MNALLYTTPPVSSYCCALTGEPLHKLDRPQNIKQQQDPNKQDQSFAPAVIKVQLPSTNPASTNQKCSQVEVQKQMIWTNHTNLLNSFPVLPPYSFCLSLHFSLFPFFSSPLPLTLSVRSLHVVLSLLWVLPFPPTKISRWN